MKSYTELLSSKGVKVGTRVSLFYGNGKHYADTIVVRVSDYFVFTSNDPNNENDNRDSHVTVLNRIKNGTWRLNN